MGFRNGFSEFRDGIWSGFTERNGGEYCRVSERKDRTEMCGKSDQNVGNVGKRRNKKWSNGADKALEFSS